MLAAYEYRAFKTEADDGPQLEELIVSAHHDTSAEVERGGGRRRGGQRGARPPERARQRDDADARWPSAPERSPGLEVEVWGRAEIEAAGMGAFAAVAQGTHEEPQLITLRYEPPDVAGPLLGLVGKGVTFDSGGISIKPGAKMSEMKFDMSGAAAVLEATGAIARLGLPVRVVTVIGATENLPSGHAVKPGDILRAKTGTTIEVINTDAEGRLVLADCLAHAIDQGAERLVDLATLTGAIVTTFGNTYAGLFGTDDEWCAAGRGGRRARPASSSGGCRCTPSTPS